MHLDAAIHVGADVAGPGVDLVGHVERVHVHAGAADGRAGIELEVKRRDDPEKARPGAAGGPVQLGVIVCVAIDLLAVGGDDLEPDDALAGGAENPAVPAVPALQQVAAQADAFTVAAREKEVLCLEIGHEQAAALAGAGDGRHVFGIDPRVVETADVKQNSAVAQMAGREAVPTRDDADPMAVGLGIAQARDDVGGIDSLHNHLGITFGHSLMPHRTAACSLVTVITAEKVPPGRKCAHPDLL
ncbi:hypothetical protein NIIDMKKI_35750 [Mycobacterium kansasii]|uniref:Uncharacterized protein n=1 Tax=Mycobacterium kansasii TaxID=1768 RepID=A0A7G1IFI6_MYCKA|nr:hypothetical protein NIIDMKKI_35750 [Mycobacterium kansasii]